jgi:hypothetical protein
MWDQILDSNILCEISLKTDVELLIIKQNFPANFFWMVVHEFTGDLLNTEFFIQVRTVICTLFLLSVKRLEEFI